MTSTVVNISSFVLIEAQVNLLQKGLSYCPTSSTDWFNLELDILQFIRRLKLTVWFQDDMHTTSNSSEIVERLGELRLKDFDLYLKSDFTPTITPHRNIHYSH